MDNIKAERKLNVFEKYLTLWVFLTHYPYSSLFIQRRDHSHKTYHDPLDSNTIIYSDKSYFLDNVWSCKSMGLYL